MSKKNIIQGIDELNNIKESSYVLFKHSLTCDISGAAFEAFNRYVENCPYSVYVLYVQEARLLSNEIAERYSVKHESPQVLFIKDGEVKWQTSHFRITESSLKEHIG